MTKTTQSGYSIRVDLFFPCHPDDIDSMRAVDHAIGMLPKTLDDVSNVAMVLIGKRKWIAYRKIPASGALVSAGDTQTQEQPPAALSVSNTIAATGLLQNANVEYNLVNDKRPQHHE